MNSRLDQLLQLTKITWDRDLISKTNRDALVKDGLATRSCGFNVITDDGIVILNGLNLIKEEKGGGVQGEGRFTAYNTANPFASQIASGIESLRNQLSDKITLAQYNDFSKYARQLRALQ